MRKVKECPNCGYYNPKLKDLCVKCGFQLENTILTIETEEEYNPNFLKEEAKEEVKPDVAIQMQFKECPSCHSILPSEITTCSCGKTMINVPVIQGYQVAQPELLTKELILEKDGKVVSLIFSPDEITFGYRDLLCWGDLSTVSTKHFIGYIKEQRIVVQDISRNGMQINEIVLEKMIPYPIQKGDEIFLANHKFKVYDIR